MPSIDTIENLKEKKSLEIEEVNYLEIIQKLWKARTFLLKTIIVFSIVGLTFALLSPNEYEAKVVLLPEISTSKTGGMLGQLGGLAALGGINLDAFKSADAIIPELYPEVIYSTPAMVYFMNYEVYIPSLNTSSTIYYYLDELHSSPLSAIKLYTIGLPFLILESIRSKYNDEELKINVGKIVLTKDEEDFIEKKLRKRVFVSINRKTGIVTISVKMPDPYVAAALTQVVKEYLTDYITNYRLSKAKTNLKFISERNSEAEINFKKAQKALATFKDSNKNVVSASVLAEAEVLQADYNLAFNIYNGLSQQYEQAKIAVQEETPVFNELEPVVVPNQKTSPKRLLILIFSMVLGMVFGGAYVLFKDRLK